MNIFVILHILTAVFVAGKMFGFGEYSWLEAFYPSLLGLLIAVILVIINRS